MDFEKESAIIEAILFLESTPATVKHLSDVSLLTEEVVSQCIETLKLKYKGPSCGLDLIMYAGGWTLMPKQEIWNQVKSRYGEKNSGNLSKSALETLSVIAYKQPITRSEIEKLRGVGADSMIRQLLEKKLIEEKGRSQGLGRPIQYGTSVEFLKKFNLNSIADLPELSDGDKERFELAR